MTLLMRDSVDARRIPADTPVVAGYGDGAFIWSPSWVDGSNWWDLFPHAVHLVIVVTAAHAGDILDVEKGDAAPADVPGWARRFNRPARRRPTIYASRDMWPQVVAALQAARLSAAAVDWWAATLDGTRDVPGAVAVQYIDTGAYDESVILDPSWVGGLSVAQLDDIQATLDGLVDALTKQTYNAVDPVGAPIPTPWQVSYAHSGVQRLQRALTALSSGALTPDLDARLTALETGVSGVAEALGRIEAALKST